MNFIEPDRVCRPQISLKTQIIHCRIIQKYQVAFHYQIFVVFTKFDKDQFRVEYSGGMKIESKICFLVMKCAYKPIR